MRHTETRLFAARKKAVLTWLRKNALGINRAKRKEQMKRIFPFSWREVRRMISALKHDGLVSSTSGNGYWAINKRSRKYEEILGNKLCWVEMRKKALSMLKDCDKNIRKWQTLINQKEIKLTSAKK